MQKKKSQKNQIRILLMTLVVAIVAITVSMIILFKDKDKNDEIKQADTSTQQDNQSSNSQLNNDESMQDNSDFSDDDGAQADSNNSEDSQNDESSEGIVSLSKLGASDLIKLTAQELINELGGSYDDYGIVDGGFTIYNYSACPSIDIAVQIDEKKEIILSEKVTAVKVRENGKISNEATVGMTYKELKVVYGNKLVPIEQSEEDALFAFVEADGYTITFEFEFSGGKSISAFLISI